MNLRRIWIMAITGLALLLGSCSSEAASISNSVKLAEEYSIGTLQTAMEDYINERLWYYPEKIEGQGMNKFDSYIGQTLQVEVRVYKDAEGQDKLYGHTNIGDWLVVFKSKDGYVYADGQVSSGPEGGWPGDSYETAGSFTVKVNPPHQIEYGDSPHKREVVAAMDKRVKALCADLTHGTDAADWKNAQVFVADFHPYEDMTTAWVIRPDGYTWITGVFAEEQEGTLTGGLTAGFGIHKIKDLPETDPTRYEFETRVLKQKPIIQFVCN